MAELPPPSDVDSENSVLSEILTHGNEVFDRIATLVDVPYFFSPSNRAIFEATRAVQQRGDHIDFMSVAGELKARQVYDKIGGARYLEDLLSVPATAYVEQSATRVRDLWRVREVQRLLRGKAAEGHGDIGDAQKWLEGIEEQVSLYTQHATDTRLEQVARIAADALDELAEARLRNDRLTGASTGLSVLDRVTGGLHDGDLIVVAGRPGMGKSTFATTLAMGCSGPRRNVQELEDATAIFSLEMPREQVAMRIVCAEANVEFSRVRNNHVNADEDLALRQTTANLAQTPIWIDDTAAVSVSYVRSVARRLRARIERKDRRIVPAKRLGLVIVDYLQLMTGRREKNGTREQEIGSLTRDLKAMAKELQVPVVALSQLNRSVETRTDKRPQLSDLRESGAIEQDADMVILLYRPGYYDRDLDDQQLAEAFVAKQRNGGEATVELHFDGARSRFASRVDGLADQYDDLFDHWETP